MRRDVYTRLTLCENRFGIEPEMTAKLAKMNVRIGEVPIRYRSRSREDGKKIGWRDGLRAVWCILFYSNPSHLGFLWISMGVSVGVHLLILGIFSFFGLSFSDFGLRNLASMNLSLPGAQLDSQYASKRVGGGVPFVREITREGVDSPHKGLSTPVDQQAEVTSPVSSESSSGGGVGSDSSVSDSSGGVGAGLAVEYLFNPRPDYPDSAKRRGQEGLVVLRVVVDQSGHPMKVTLKESSRVAILDESALKAVKKWKFKPSVRAGGSVDFAVDVPIRFSLK
jgi:TonB family protein